MYKCYTFNKRAIFGLRSHHLTPAQTPSNEKMITLHFFFLVYFPFIVYKIT